MILLYYMEATCSLLVEVQKFWLQSFVHVEDERKSSEIFIEGVLTVLGIGNFQQKWQVVGLVVVELPGSVQQDLEGTIVVDLTQGGWHASFLSAVWQVDFRDPCKFSVS